LFQFHFHTRRGPEKRRHLSMRQQDTPARRSDFSTQLALLELHVHAAASGVDSNALLCGGNADYHASLI